jgi:hypothetical protein
MKIDVLVYSPGAMLPKPEVIELPNRANFAALDAAIKPLIGGAIRHIEHVSVLFRDRPSDMFVDEDSAQFIAGRPPLPVNEAATLIYHENSRRRGADLTDAPCIHGVAVVCLTRVWF